MQDTLFHKNGEIVSFNPLQIMQGAADGLTPLTPDAYEALLNSRPVDISHATCTPSQGLVALYALQKITESDVQQAINGIADDLQRYTAQIAYSRATVWQRDSATMQTLAQLLQLSDSDLDELFNYAAGVQV